MGRFLWLTTSPVAAGTWKRWRSRPPPTAHPAARAGMSTPAPPASHPTSSSQPTSTLFPLTFPSAKTAISSTAAASVTPKESWPRRSPPPMRCVPKGSAWACSSSAAKSATQPAPRSPTSAPGAAASSSTASPRGKPPLAKPRAGKAPCVLILHASGTMAHSAYPELGESAIHKLVEVLSRLLKPRPARRHTEDVGPTTVNVGLIQGGRPRPPSTV